MPFYSGGLWQVLQSYRYAYPTARVKALKGLLLSEDKFHSMTASADLKEALRVLGDTVYWPLLSGKGDIDSIEFLIKRHAVDTFFRVGDFLPGSAKTIFREYLRSYESENVKAVIVGIQGKVAPKNILKTIFPLYIDISGEAFERMASSKSVADVVSMLEGTLYHEPLGNAYKDYEESGLFLKLEVALDKFIYERLSSSLSVLTGPDIDFFKKMLGMEVDIKNLKSMIRLLKGRTKPHDILSYLIPRGHELDLQYLEELSEAHDYDDLINRLEGTRYFEPLSRSKKPGDKEELGRRPVMLEKALDDLRSEIGRIMDREYPLGIGPILGYMVAKADEAAKLTLILRLKEAGFKKAEIEEVLTT